MQMQPWNEVMVTRSSMNKESSLNITNMQTFDIYHI